MKLQPRRLINAIALQSLDRSDHNLDWNELSSESVADFGRHASYERRVVAFHDISG
jgi:hypothetical protein